jgi:hypothetical protein
VAAISVTTEADRSSSFHIGNQTPRVLQSEQNPESPFEALRFSSPSTVALQTPVAKPKTTKPHIKQQLVSVQADELSRGPAAALEER